MSPQPQRTSLTAFTWGYWGWGESTAELLRLTQQVEAARGFSAPVFVDIRARRAVRANGFRGDAFQRLAPRRSHWLPALGNKRVLERRRGVQIIDPSAAAELLELVVKSAEQRRRVVFFCSCASPAGASTCHRAEVRRLLLAVARRRGVAIAVVEWPGSAPEIRAIRCAPEVIGRVRRCNSGSEVLLAPIRRPDTVALAQLGHGSVGLLYSKDDEVLAVTGPVVRRSRGWHLPVYAQFPVARLGMARRAARKQRKQLGLPPVDLDASSKVLAALALHAKTPGFVFRALANSR